MAMTKLSKMISWWVISCMASIMMVGRVYDAEDGMIGEGVEVIDEGGYGGEVPVELIEDDTGWSPYLSLEDAKKLDAVRLALRRGEVAEAAKHGRVFELTPISA